MKKLILLLFLVASFISSATTETTDHGWKGWVTRDGKPVPNSNAMKSIGGFGGWLIVTPDLDWEEKWNTPVESTPSFKQATQIKYGEELTILTFYVNPELNEKEELDIVCDIKIKRPDGTYAIDAKDIQCAGGKLRGNRKNVRLTSAVIKVIGEDGDPSGVWEVYVKLTDKNSQIEMPLSTQFELIEKFSN